MSRRKRPLSLPTVKITCSCQGKPRVVETILVDGQALDEGRWMRSQPLGTESPLGLMKRYQAAVAANRIRQESTPLIKAADAEKRTPDGIHFVRAGVDEHGEELVQATPEWTCAACTTSVRPHFARGVLEKLAEAGVYEVDLRALARTLSD